MSKLNDLTAAEREHAGLVQHLEQFYATQAQDVQDLDMIHTQLQQEFTLPVGLPEASTSHVSSLSGAESRRQGIYAFPTPRKTRWAHQLSLLVAIVVMTLVTGTFASLLYLSHQHNTTTGSGGLHTPTVTVVPSSFEAPMSASMMSATVGWLQDGKGNVKHTTDSGQTWQDVTPPSTVLPKEELARSFYPISAANAWIVNGRMSGIVISTIDGGLHWQKSSPKLSNGKSIMPMDISFFNSQEGWAVTPGYDNKVPDLVSTHDGGKTWSVTGSLPSTNETHLYGMGMSNGYLNFTSTTSGWCVYVSIAQGKGNVHQKTILYHTHDAGQTWQPFTVPDLSTPLFVYAPLFFNASDGVFVEESIDTPAGKTPEQSITLYVTHDGGASWVATPTVKGYEWSIHDANHWWVLEDNESFNSVTQQASNQITIHSTSDAGQHWLTSPQPQFTSMSLVPCSTNQCGSGATSWATGFITNSKESHLYKTTDGGKTWFQID